MKTNKKFYAFMLSLAMMLSAISPAFAAVVNYGDELKNMPSKSCTQKFKDVPTSHWAFNYIAEMAERGVLSGYPDGKFYPDKNVSRAEFAKIMTSAAGLTPVEDSNTYSEYSDSKSSTHRIKHSVVLTEAKKRELEERIADELYRIFTHKVV